MNILDSFIQKAKADKKTIVLPEGNDIRTILAADKILKEDIANLILLGNIEQINKIAQENNADVSKAQIIDPQTATDIQDYADAFYELRKHKGITPEKAMASVKDEVYYGTMMMQLNKADGLVSGAVHSTADTIRPSLQIIKTAPGVKLVSSYFIIYVPDCEFGDEGLFFFADCAVNPDPNAEQVAEIAVTTANSAQAICGMDPKVAMLSFSTKGSAKNPAAEKMAQATKIAQEKAPKLNIDGELQLDAAIVPEVAQTKSPDSNVAGQANVLIFPDLQSGNIGYKLAQRLGKGVALGPILQGLNRPVNDLSRGCNVDDIVNVVAITAVQAQNNK